MKRVLVTLFFTLTAVVAEAQCAMCRATLENNLSDGQLEVGSTINTGILYLFVTPYLVIGLVAFFWYKHSRAHAAG